MVGPDPLAEATDYCVAVETTVADTDGPVARTCEGVAGSGE